MKKTGIIRHFCHYIEYTGLRFISLLLMLIPESCIYVLARFFGLVVFHCLRIRRDVAMENLRYALGDVMDESGLKIIAREAYYNIGVTFLEMLLVPKFKHRILTMVEMSEIDILKRNLEQRRGLILVSCHFGSWELNGAALGLSGIPVTVVVKSQSNPYVDEFINRYRKDFGMKIVPTGAAIKHLIKTLSEHGTIGLISDQDAGKNGVFVTFFGRMASTPAGAAQLALKYDVPVIVTMTQRIAAGKYKSIFREVDVLADDTVESLTQRYTTVMEKIIRQCPEQYFWMHRRWKTRPSENTLRSAECLSCTS